MLILINNYKTTIKLTNASLNIKLMSNLCVIIFVLKRGCPISESYLCVITNLGK